MRSSCLFPLVSFRSKQHHPVPIPTENGLVQENTQEVPNSGTRASYSPTSGGTWLALRNPPLSQEMLRTLIKDSKTQEKKANVGNSGTTRIPHLPFTPNVYILLFLKILIYPDLPKTHFQETRLLRNDSQCNVNLHSRYGRNKNTSM